MVKLFFGGFPLEFTELDIAMLVGFHGDIITIKIVRYEPKKTYSLHANYGGWLCCRT